MQAIFRFLAMLDLIQQLKIELKVGEGINNCWIRYNDNLEASFIEAERLLAEKEGRQPNEFSKKLESEDNENANENKNENEKSEDTENKDVNNEEKNNDTDNKE